MAALKAGGDPATAERVTTFAGQDLAALGVPSRAWPLMDKEYKGKKGYTVHSSNGAEAHLRSNPYVVAGCSHYFPLQPEMNL